MLPVPILSRLTSLHPPPLSAVSHRCPAPLDDRVEKARNEEQLRVMREMNSLKVDLTKVLVSQQPHVDSVIKLDTGAGSRPESSATAAAAGKGLIGALQLNL